jgi:endonuclease YncB( thermonuclease family)
MAGLNSQTTYGTTGSSPMGGFPDLMKTMAQRASADTSTEMKKRIGSQFRTDQDTAPAFDPDPTKSASYITPKYGEALGSPAPELYTPSTPGAWQRQAPASRGGGTYEVRPTTGKKAKMISVVDADTIKVQREDGTVEDIRMLGYNAPEVPHEGIPGKRVADRPASEWAPGIAATEELRKILPAGSTVNLEADTTQKDEYNRPLYNVWGGEGTAGENTLVGQVLAARMGYDKPYQYAKPGAAPADIKYPGRAISGVQSEENLALLKSRRLSPLIYTVTPIVPTWSNGQDVPSNKQILDKTSADKMAVIQSVPLTLLANGAFTGTIEQQRSQANQMAMDWKKRDPSGLPSIDEINAKSGYIPLELAKKMAEKWRADEIPSTWKLFKGSLAENVQGFLSPRMRENVKQTLGLGSGVNPMDLSAKTGVVGEFGKGLAGGTGMVTHTEAPEDATFAEKSANFAGGLVSTLVGFGFAGKVLARTGAFGKAIKAGTVPIRKYGGIGLGQAVDKAIPALGMGIKTVEEMKVASDLFKATDAIINGVTNYGNAVKATERTLGVGGSIYRGGLTMATFGQLGLLTREMTGQEKFEYEKNLKQAATDMIYGGLILGTAGIQKGGTHGLRGYAHVGGGTMMWELMMGATVEEALKGGITMTALHGMGHKGGLRGFVDGETKRIKMFNDELYHEGRSVAAEEFPDIIPHSKRNEPVAETWTMSSEDVGKVHDLMVKTREEYAQTGKKPFFINIPPDFEINTQNQAIQYLKELHKERTLDNVKGAAKAEDISLFDEKDKLKREFQRITTAYNVLENQMLSPAEREMKLAKDIHTSSAALRPQLVDPKDADYPDLYKRTASAQETTIPQGELDAISKNYEPATPEKPATGQEPATEQRQGREITTLKELMELAAEEEASAAKVAQTESISPESLNQTPTKAIMDKVVLSGETDLKGSSMKHNPNEYATKKEITSGVDAQGKPVAYENFVELRIDREDVRFMHIKKQRQLRNPEKVQPENVEFDEGKYPLGREIVDPEMTVRVYAFKVLTDEMGNKTRERRSIGFLPQEKSLTREDGSNKTFKEIDKRLQSILQQYGDDPIKLQQILALDKSMKDDSGKVIQRLAPDVGQRVVDEIKKNGKVSTKDLLGEKFMDAKNAQVELTVYNKNVVDMLRANGKTSMLANMTRKYVEGGRISKGDPRSAKSQAEAYIQIGNFFFPDKMASEVAVPKVEVNPIVAAIDDAVAKVKAALAVPQKPKAPFVVPKKPSAERTPQEKLSEGLSDMNKVAEKSASAPDTTEKAPKTTLGVPKKPNVVVDTKPVEETLVGENEALLVAALTPDTAPKPTSDRGPAIDPDIKTLNTRDEAQGTYAGEDIIEKTDITDSKPLAWYDVTSQTDGGLNFALKAKENALRKKPPEDTAEGRAIRAKADAWALNYDGKKLIDYAKNAMKRSNDNEEVAFEKFKKLITDEFIELGYEDPITENTKQAFLKRFRDAIFNEESNTFTSGETKDYEGKITSIIGVPEKKTYAPLSWFEKMAGPSRPTIYYESNRELTRKPDEAVKIQHLIDEDFVWYRYDNAPDSLMGVQYDKKYSEKVLDEKGQPMTGKRLSEMTLDQQDVAMSHFSIDMLKKAGFDPNTDSINTFVKRLKTLNSREHQIGVKGKTLKHYVIPSEFSRSNKNATSDWEEMKVNSIVAGATRATVKNKVTGEVRAMTDSEILEQQLAKSSTNGMQLMSPEFFEEASQGSGFVHFPTVMKTTQSHNFERGGNFHQKHASTAWLPQEKAYYEKLLGVKLGKYDVVTFEDNIKTGYGKVGKKIDRPDGQHHWEVDAPSESYFVSWNGPHKNTRALSPGSILTKIDSSSKFGEGLGKIISKHYGQSARDIHELVNAMHESSGSYHELKAIWDASPFKEDRWMDNLYGESALSAQHGAGYSQLGTTLNKKINSLIESYTKGRWMKGDDLVMRPEFTPMVDNGDGTRRFLKSGETMISEHTFKKLYGEKALKHLRKGNDYYVLSFRYPTLKPTSVTKMKVLIAEDHGHNIGEEYAITNGLDTVKFDHDYDIDSLQIYALGGKDGVPLEMAKYFEEKAKEGEMPFADLTKTPKVPMIPTAEQLKAEADSGVTGSPEGWFFRNYRKMVDANIKGKEAVGISAASVRNGFFLAANKYEAHFGGVKGVKREVKHFFGGKQVGETEFVPQSRKGGDGVWVKQFKDDKPFKVSILFTDKESYVGGNVGQEAVDSVGNSDLNIRLAKNNGDASAYMFETMFPDAKDIGAKNVIRSFVDQFQTPFNVEKALEQEAMGKKNVYDTMGALQPYIDTLKKLEAEGGTLGPAEEVFKNLDGLKPFDTQYKNDENQRARDNSAAASVRERFPEIEQTPLLTVTQKVIKKIQSNTVRGKGKDRKEILLAWWNDGFDTTKEVEKDWKKLLPPSPKAADKTESAKESVSAWMASSGDAVIDPTYGLRVIPVINESPEVAKAYYAGENAWTKEHNQKIQRKEAKGAAQAGGQTRVAVATGPGKTERDVASNAEGRGEGINVLSMGTAVKQYGNPFEGQEGAIDRYRNWILGKADQDVRPEQLKWIQQQIKDRVLEGKVLFGNKDVVPGEKSHADVISDIANAFYEANPKSNEPPTEGGAAVPKPEAPSEYKHPNDRVNQLVQENLPKGGFKRRDPRENTDAEYKRAAEERIAQRILRLMGDGTPLPKEDPQGHLSVEYWAEVYKLDAEQRAKEVADEVARETSKKDKEVKLTKLRSERDEIPGPKTEVGSSLKIELGLDESPWEKIIKVKELETLDENTFKLTTSDEKGKEYTYVVDKNGFPKKDGGTYQIHDFRPTGGGTPEQLARRKELFQQIKDIKEGKSPTPIMPQTGQKTAEMVKPKQQKLPLPEVPKQSITQKIQAMISARNPHTARESIPVSNEIVEGKRYVRPKKRTTEQEDKAL